MNEIAFYALVIAPVAVIAAIYLALIAAHLHRH